MKKTTYTVISLIIFLIAMILLAAIVVPLICSYNDPEKFNGFISGFGVWGIAIMFFIQVAQIVVALIPGELVEFVAGTLYGWFGGLIFCLAGIAVGQAIIFKCVQVLGRDFVEKAAGSKAMSKLRFLQDDKKLKSVIFILFFIPGTPKDLITYVAPFTKIRMKDFLIITLLARIPSVVSSTFAGSAFADKDFITLAVAYGIIAVFSVAGVIVYRKWEERHEVKTPVSTEEKEPVMSGKK